MLAVENAAVQAELDRIGTEDALVLLSQLGSNQDSAAALWLVKRWLKKHWSDGWLAAGGPSGAPKPSPAKRTCQS